MPSLYGPRIVTNGLVLYLDAGNNKSYPGSGNTWFDLSGNNNNGTLTNGPTFSSSNGGSIVFDGVDDVCISSNNMGITGDINATLSVWVNFITISSAWNCQIMFGDPFTVRGGFAIFEGADAGAGGLFLGFYGGKGAYITSVVTTNTWYNIVATKSSGIISSSNTKLYLNGNALSLTFNCIGETVNAQNNKLRVCNDQADETGNSNIALAMAYNRALSATEVAQNYNALKARFGL